MKKNVSNRKRKLDRCVANSGIENKFTGYCRAIAERSTLSLALVVTFTLHIVKVVQDSGVPSVAI